MYTKHYTNSGEVSGNNRGFSEATVMVVTRVLAERWTVKATVMRCWVGMRMSFGIPSKYHSYHAETQSLALLISVPWGPRNAKFSIKAV